MCARSWALSVQAFSGLGCLLIPLVKQVPQAEPTITASLLGSFFGWGCVNHLPLLNVSYLDSKYVGRWSSHLEHDL